MLVFRYLGNARQKMTTVVDCVFLALLSDVSHATVSF